MHYSAYVQLTTRYTCTSLDKSYQVSCAIYICVASNKIKAGAEKASHELYLLVDGNKSHDHVGGSHDY